MIDRLIAFVCDQPELIVLSVIIIYALLIYVLGAICAYALKSLPSNQRD
jgi:hypothetical protein